MGRMDNLTHDEAWEMATNLRAILLKENKAANYCICNRNGQILVQASMDKARPVTLHIALLKAQQSASTGERTRWMSEKVASGEVTLELFNWCREKFVPWAGGRIFRI